MDVRTARRASVLTVVVTLLAAVGWYAGPRLQASPSLGGATEDVVVHIDGSPLPRTEYLEYLGREYGPSRMTGFVDDWLVRRRAKELGVAVDRASLEVYVDQKIEREIERLFGGDAAQFNQSLVNRRMTKAQYREWQITRETSRFLADDCILAVRNVTPDRVVAKFEELYGAGGVHRRIRHIYLLNDRDRAAKNSGDRTVDPRPVGEIVSEIQRLLERDASRFGELAMRFSDDGFTRANGGQLPGYRPGQMELGEAFDLAVASLQDPMQVSGMIKATRGVHVVQLLSRNVTQIDTVREEIASHLEAEAPTAAERRSFIEEQRKKARIEP